jgi:hypothetical protein
VNVSNSTILQCLQKSGYRHWRVKKQPQITEEAAKKYL